MIYIRKNNLTVNRVCRHIRHYSDRTFWVISRIWMGNITFFKYISTINNKKKKFLLMLYGTPSYCNVNVYTCISYRFNLLGKSSNSAGPFFLNFTPPNFFETYFLTNIAKFENFKTVKKVSLHFLSTSIS